ncbi:PaaI family thioesterase [Bacillus massiliigorillae]|uniref:PaaI family thioesterase n=1 Tax=Bacillus massiliigorillae TaxID=1243664 RepID=UPI0003A21C9E|nr:PaaI family thioesterase [Bacillus massiliigorillae]
MIKTKLTLEDIQLEFEQCPFFLHLGLSVVKFEEGNVVIKISVMEYLKNTHGTLHGGVIASILDFIQCMQIRSVIDCRCLTLNLNTQYIASVSEGDVYASATILSNGYKTAFAEGVLTDEQGNLIAKGTGAFKLVRS